MAARPRVALSDTYLSIDQPRQWLHRITSALLTQAEQIKQSADFATPLQANFGLPLRAAVQKGSTKLRRGKSFKLLRSSA